MDPISPSSAGIKSRTLILTWLLTLLLAAYLVENLWVDGWIRSKFTGLPGFVPAPLSFLWFVVFGVGGICCVVLVVCLVLVSRHRGLSLRAKVCTGIAVVGACVLWGVWFDATNGGTSGTSVAAEEHKKHSVKLTWTASTSVVAGYNVYRSTVKGREYTKINSVPVKGTTYTDDTAEGGKTYFYVTRSVDAKGKESGDSAEVVVAVP